MKKISEIGYELYNPNIVEELWTESQLTEKAEIIVLQTHRCNATCIAAFGFC